MKYEKAEYGQNEELIDTSIVRSQLERWKKQNYTLEHIKIRLWEIHLIKIKKEKLKKILSKINNDKE